MSQADIHLFGGVNYSLEEQVIGTWLDGKPLYQRSFEWTYLNGTLIPSTELLELPNDSNIRVICDGCLKYTDSNNATGYTPIATLFPTAQTNTQWAASFSNVSPTKITFQFGSGWLQSSYTNMRISVTIRYTKTSD